MTRLRFGLDMDGVLYDWHSAARFLLSQWSGREITEKELFSTWRSNFDEIAGPGADDFLWGEGVRQGLFRHGHVRKGAIAFTQELDKIADIVIVTHRPRQARQDTLDWLAFHRIPIKEIHLLENMEPKWEVDLDCLLDDKFDNVQDFYANTDKTGLLWSRAWNEMYYWPERMSTWQEVLNWVQEQLKTRRLE